MKLLTQIIIFTSIILLGCSGNDQNPCSLSEEVLTELVRLDSIFNDSLERQKQKGWMKSTYDEPEIFEADHETYRLVIQCFGSFTYTKIVRIEKLENHFKAVVKEFVDTIEYGILTPTLNYDFELTGEDWQLIINKLKDDNFWISTESNHKQLLHGCIWYIEGYKPIKDKCSLKNYHGIYGIYPVDSLYIEMYELFDKLEKNKRATTQK